MCGIWASLGFDPPRGAIDSVAHRGPDGEGWREFATDHGPLVLAHRRLAVIDPTAAGDQPMVYEDGRYWIVFNGVIYNYVELRDELSALGHRFASRCDTEVLLASYAEWGAACLDRFNGMFAFVLWDARDRRLFAARDRFGIKPIYWLCDQHGLAFASEIKQLACHPGFSARLDPGRARDFLAFGLRDHDTGTLFRGVNQLGSGECMVVDLDAWRPGGDPTAGRWYARPHAGTIDLPADEAAHEIAALFTDSVRLRLRADAPLGFCLSGGLDSSSIVCTAGRQPLAGNPATVSACYDDPEADERTYIDAVTAATNAKSLRVYPDGSEMIGALDRIIRHHDAPVTSTSMLAQWSVFEAARQAGLKVMLDGQGADEQFCGYHTAFTAFHTALVRRCRPVRLMRELAGQRRRHGTSPWWQLAVLGAALLPEPIRQRVRYLRGTHRPEWLRTADGAGSGFPLPRADNLNDLILSHMFETSLPMLLHYEDRNSMAHGIESRLPFLDHRLVEFVVGLGDRHKIVDGETKWILRRAMAGVLPPLIRTRQDKIGFATPERTWLLGPMRDHVAAAVEDVTERFPDLFQEPAVRRFADDVLDGGRPYDPSLWRIVSFATWARVFGVEA